MSITFNETDKLFVISTNNTEYAFKICYDRFLVHVYYGEKGKSNYDFKPAYRSFSPYMSDVGEGFSFNDDFIEFPFYGSGDFRAPALKLRAPAGDC